MWYKNWTVSWIQRRKMKRNGVMTKEIEVLEVVVAGGGLLVENGGLASFFWNLEPKCNFFNFFCFKSDGRGKIDSNLNIIGERVKIIVWRVIKNRDKV